MTAAPLLPEIHVEEQAAAGRVRDFFGHTGNFLLECAESS